MSHRGRGASPGVLRWHKMTPDLTLLKGPDDSEKRSEARRQARAAKKLAATSAAALWGKVT